MFLCLDAREKVTEIGCINVLNKRPNSRKPVKDADEARQVEDRGAGLIPGLVCTVDHPADPHLFRIFQVCRRQEGDKRKRPEPVCDIKEDLITGLNLVADDPEDLPELLLVPPIRDTDLPAPRHPPGNHGVVRCCGPLCGEEDNFIHGEELEEGLLNDACPAALPLPAVVGLVEVAAPDKRERPLIAPESPPATPP